MNCFLMRTLLIISIFIAPFFAAFAKGTDFKVTKLGQLIRVDANPKRGFNFPFFLYIPENNLKTRSLLIVPNNSGSSQDFESQIWQAERQALSEASVAVKISSILLVPAFPRPQIEPALYTHSLSRSALLVKDGPLKRVDIQLIKMTEMARELLKERYKIALREKFFLSGFSAAAMFVNRFAFIHPKLVAGIAVGAPGGWPLAPLKTFKDKTLPYPVGIDDIGEVAGDPVDFESLKKIPFFFFLGDKDENDSVVYRDSYTEADEKLIFSLFGKKPVERWPIAEKIYSEAGLNVRFNLYKDLGHETNQTVRDDVIKFFNGIKVD
jgi:predicted esterase